MRVENIQIYKIENSDRFISVTRKEGSIIGINYMQGCHEDELKLFKDKYLVGDNELTKYVISRIIYASDTTEIEEIDRLIWQYVEREVLLCEINEKIEQQISEIVQENCKSGDVSPCQSIKLEEYTNKLAELTAEIVAQNQ